MLYYTNWFSNLYDIISSGIELVVGFLKSTFTFFGAIPGYVLEVIRAAAFLPSFVIPFVTLSLGLTVTFLVLGRSNNT